jgi:hypothetical protein
LYAYHGSLGEKKRFHFYEHLELNEKIFYNRWHSIGTSSKIGNFAGKGMTTRENPVHQSIPDQRGWLRVDTEGYGVTMNRPREEFPNYKFKDNESKTTSTYSANSNQIFEGREAMTYQDRCVVYVGPWPDSPNYRTNRVTVFKSKSRMTVFEKKQLDRERRREWEHWQSGTNADNTFYIDYIEMEPNDLNRPDSTLVEMILRTRAKPVANHRIEAVWADDPTEVIAATTDASGRAVFELPPNKTWLMRVAIIHPVRASDPKKQYKQWESYWFTQTIHIRITDD